MHSNATQLLGWEKLTLVGLGGNVYAIRTYNGHYLTVVGGGARTSDAIHSDATSIGSWENSGFRAATKPASRTITKRASAGSASPFGNLPAHWPFGGYPKARRAATLDVPAQTSAADDCRQCVVIDRNRITGGGITAGIDFGLVVAAQLHGRHVAEQIQLMMEYDPAPPFTSGSPDSADTAQVEQARAKTSSNREQRRQIAERAAALLRLRAHTSG